MTQKYDRFKAAPWFQEGVRPPVLIGGAGGIGSWLTVLLNRAGFETYVFDHDNLEAINMAGQLFFHSSIGKTKVDALNDVVNSLCQDSIIPNYAKVDESTMTNNIVFSAFDNMKARQDMFKTWVSNFLGNAEAVFIDGRLTAEQLTIFVVKGNDQDAIVEYQSHHLFDDSEVEELACTFKQTSHGAAMIAAHMTEMFTNWYSGVLGKDPSRSADFFWEYFIPLGYMNSRKAGKVEYIDINLIPEENQVLSSIEDPGSYMPITIPTPEDEEDIDETLSNWDGSISNEQSNPPDPLGFEEEGEEDIKYNVNPTISNLDDLPFNL